MEFSECKYCLITIDFSVYTISLNRPEKRNALNKEMIHELIDVISFINNHTKGKVIVLKGKGDTFCSGADLEWMKLGLTQNLEENISDALLFKNLYLTIRNSRIPIITYIHGGAYGGAVGLIACADIVITEKNAQFGFPEVKLGLVPAMVAPYIIEKIGISQAKRYMLTAETISSDIAFQIGLVHTVTDIVNDKKTISNITRKMLKNSTNAVKATKQLINNISDSFHSSLTDEQANIIAKARSSEEGQEGVKAFFEKRQPNWNAE